MDLASAEAEIRHVFGDTPITEASIGVAPPDILVKLSGSNADPHSPPNLGPRVFSDKAADEDPLSYTIYLETAFPAKKCNRKHGGL